MMPKTRVQETFLRWQAADRDDVETLEAWLTKVHARGSTIADDDVPEHAYDMAGKQAALRLRARLNQLRPGETVLIVGGGLTSIEVAAEIAEEFVRPQLFAQLTAAPNHFGSTPIRSC
ncbi:hypothetical protein ACQPXH_16760 [Nocardia sp. CA-135953]|uniref:hypothetical protein n=1 Tax=Nocardia sp. CA-135953 TaxID=3239978 RepID=UPI003D9915DB